MNSKQSLQTNSIYKLMGMKANLDWRKYHLEELTQLLRTTSFKESTFNHNNNHNNPYLVSHNKQNNNQMHRQNKSKSYNTNLFEGPPQIEWTNEDRGTTAKNEGLKKHEWEGPLQRRTEEARMNGWWRTNRVQGTYSNILGVQGRWRSKWNLLRPYPLSPILTWY